MKIVVDCRTYSLSGLGRYVKDIVPGLCAHYDSVTLLGNLKELQHYADDYKSVSLIEATASIYSIREQIELRNKIPVCDIFFAPHFNIPLLPIKAKKRVTTMHDAYHLAFYEKLSLPQKIYAKLFYKGALRLSDKIITISEFSKQEFLRLVSKKYDTKIEVIYRFVGDVIKANITETSNEINAHQGKFFLFVGNVKPNKNLKAALLGFKTFVTNKPIETQGYTFKIVGKREGFGTDDPEVKNLIEQDTLLQERVQFTGHVSDFELIALYRNATALVFPSIYEGFGLPPLEAMYFGCPALCSNAACIPEVCGDAPLYFHPSNPLELAAKMWELITVFGLQDTLAKRGREQVKKYTREKALEEHIRLFDKLVAK